MFSTNTNFNSKFQNVSLLHRVQLIMIPITKRFNCMLYTLTDILTQLLLRISFVNYIKNTLMFTETRLATSRL